MNDKNDQLPFQISNLCELFDTATRRYCGMPMMEQIVDGRIQKISFSSFRHDVCRLSAYFIRQELENSYVMLTGQFTYYWLVAFFALARISSKIICADENLIACDASELIQHLPVLCAIGNDNITTFGLCEKQITFEQIRLILTNGSDHDFLSSVLLRNNSNRDISDETAVIIFTSGTTGETKPVYLSHKNIADDIMGSQILVGRNSNDRLLSFLPVHHAFELTVGILVPFYVGATVCVSRGVGYLIEDMRIYAPTILIIVPLIAQTFRKLIDAVIRKHKANNAANIMQESYRGCSVYHGNDSFDESEYEIARSVFGGQLSAFVCGGALLSSDLLLYFRNLGFTFFYGYGITECSPVVCCSSNAPNGSVGKPHPFCEVTCINGELCIKGSVVASSKPPDINRHMCFYEGWFQTGDLGYKDADGNVYITGRKDELIVLENGENVSPNKVENLLKPISGIDEVLVYADESMHNSTCLSAIIRPIDAVANDTDMALKQYFLAEIANLNLPNKYRISEIQILRVAFLRTNSGKIKRKETISLVIRSESETYES